jgi:riboflavin synthase
MFTGIVEAAGRIRSTEAKSASLLMTITSGLSEVAAGESIAINGVCLTAVEPNASGDITFLLSRETLDRSNLGLLRPADVVNMERALLPNTRLSGHLVQGHIDGLAKLTSVTRVGEAREARFSLPATLARYCVEKGSIALDGVSLTINGIHAEASRSAEIAIMLIPYTWEHTRFHTLAPGAAVNVEVDIIGKYVEKLCQAFNQR